MARVDVDGLLRRIGEVLGSDETGPSRGCTGRGPSNGSSLVWLDGWMGSDPLSLSPAGGVAHALPAGDGDGCVVPRPLPALPPGVRCSVVTLDDVVYRGPSWRAAFDAADANARMLAGLLAGLLERHRHRVYRAAPGVWIAERIRTKDGDR